MRSHDLKKAIIVAILLAGSLLCPISAQAYFNYVDTDTYTGEITVCFSATMIGNTRGEFSISYSDGIVVTPFDWFNKIALQYEIVSLRQKYRVKDIDWHLNGLYPMNVYTITIKDPSRNDELLKVFTEESLRFPSTQMRTILFAEKEPIYRIQLIPNDPLHTQQWALDKIQAYDAWDIVSGCENEIIIGIVDVESHRLKGKYVDQYSRIARHNNKLGNW